MKKKNRKIHLIGICGTGMSALAVLFNEALSEVSGSDQDFFGPIPEYLEKKKITFYKKYDAKNVPKDADLIVVGNIIPLSSEENPEKKEALRLGLKIQSLPEALSDLSKDTENIVVVGSSGKSTVAGMLAWCLHEAKMDPSYFIGALPLDLKNSAHMGRGKEFVIEGDEYTSSKEDKRSKFLHLNPSSAILTSAAHDHINIFPTEESYKESFKKFVEKIPGNGLLVYSENGTNNKEISRHAKCKTVSYSLDQADADWHAENIKYGMQSSFDLMHRDKKVVEIKTTLLGRHNLENIVGVGALLLSNKKMTPETFAQGVASFHGIAGRLELKNKNSAIPVFEGFGSSYEKARAIFDALRLHFPGQRIIAVFEPHAFVWRNRKFLKWYEDIFNDVDEVIMLPAEGHGKPAEDQLNTAEVWGEAKKYKNIRTVENEKEGLQVLQEIVREGDVVALVSSGDMLGLKNSVPKLIEKYK